MLAGAVGDLAGEAGGAIRAHVNDATPPRSPLRVAPGILDHHQGHAAAVHGEVLIVALSRDSEGADTSSSMPLRPEHAVRHKGIWNTVRRIVDEDVCGPERGLP